jgi:hypothetical protein
LPWLRRLQRLCGMQRLPLRRGMWRMRRRMWRMRCWLDRDWRALGILRRLLCIVGPLPLVLGGDAS